MNITEPRILEILSKGESQSVEFKSQLPNTTILARLISSFANTEGGIIFIGVSDKGEIIGLSENEISNGIKKIQNIGDSLLDYKIPIEIHQIKEKIILVINVRKIEKGSLPILTATGEMYIRDGESIKKAIAKVMARNMSHNIGSHVLHNSIKEANFNNQNDKQTSIFIAMSFREEEEPALVDYHKAMERAVQNLDLDIQINRMDEKEGDYEISQQIMAEIDKSDILIADFTLSSHNVYFELGYARAKGKLIIQTARKGTKLEFDTRNWRTIFYRNATELEAKIEPAIKAAYKQIKNESST